MIPVSDSPSPFQRAATFLLLPGVVLRNLSVVFTLAVFANRDNLPDDLADAFRDDAWVAQLRSVVYWDALEADWPLATTVQSLTPVIALLAVSPYKTYVLYPITYPGMVPVAIWLPVTYLVANLAYATLTDIAVFYADFAGELHARWRSHGGDS